MLNAPTIQKSAYLARLGAISLSQAVCIKPRT